MSGKSSPLPMRTIRPETRLAAAHESRAGAGCEAKPRRAAISRHWKDVRFAAAKVTPEA
jgi:hypothetical protein